MVAKHAATATPIRLERRRAEHQAEVVRLRARFGDPEEALSSFIRNTFSYEALLATYLDEMEGEEGWLDNDVNPHLDAR